MAWVISRKINVPLYQWHSTSKVYFRQKLMHWPLNLVIRVMSHNLDLKILELVSLEMVTCSCCTWLIDFYIKYRCRRMHLLASYLRPKGVPREEELHRRFRFGTPKSCFPGVHFICNKFAMAKEKLIRVSCV
ncbi:hypothetical protein QQP08_001283 [Theobroma cacao]|nr:hypothetical protein QQP08_001283 [Theobroma cacao]